MPTRHVSLFALLLTAIAVVAELGPADKTHPQSRFIRQQRAPAATAVANSSMSIVCTPSECLEGQHSLAAGVAMSTQYNQSTVSVTLLPGTFTPSLLAQLANSSASFSHSTLEAPRDGFSISGQASSSLTVTLDSGVTLYDTPLYQGVATHVDLASTNSSFNATAASLPAAQSALLQSSTFAIFTDQSGGRLVAWSSLASVAELPGSPSGLELVDAQSSKCSTVCASGGTCGAAGSCICREGWTGATCNACLPGHFGRDCAKCVDGCSKCDEGVTGTGVCLDVSTTANVTLPSSCNCINGVCATGGSRCACNTGWTTAANGTQCAACEAGFFMSASGDCLACDPTCAACSSPSGTCQTCRETLSPSSSSSTKCEPSQSSLGNGTFVTCANREFFDSSSKACVTCNPVCETCTGSGADQCTACRSPRVLLDGGCVAWDSSTGVCAGPTSANGTRAGGGWVFDNDKGVCDPLPAKCTAGAIDNFSASSSRSEIKCSACLPGSYLVDGACSDQCPDGTTVSADGIGCTPCDSSCATCSGMTASDCTACTTSVSLLLNGTCIGGPSCPTGYFQSPATSSNATATCLACHPDCETCGPNAFDTCLTCPANRPVLVATSCRLTCSSSEYFDPAKSACTTCDSSCATCSGAGSSQCMSCPGSETTLERGRCVPTPDACSTIPLFGVCLSQLVTVAERLSTPEIGETKTKLPWWSILVLVLVLLALSAGGVYLFRKREQKRRRLHTAKFAAELGQKEVDIKLARLDPRVAHPPLPTASPTPTTISSVSYDDLVQRPRTKDDEHQVIEVPLTPRFVISNSPTESESTRWSRSSMGSAMPAPQPSRLMPQATGQSVRSNWASNNPFNKAAQRSAG